MKSNNHTTFWGKPLMALILTVWMLVPVHAQEAPDPASAEEKEMKGFAAFYNTFIDWAALSYGTYTGQSDAELGSVFAKLKEGLDNSPELQEFVGEASTAITKGALEESARVFTNKTGVGLYILPQLDNPQNRSYVKTFNSFLAEGASAPLAPYVLVKVNVKGTKKTGGYTVTASVEGSSEIKMKKYGMDQWTEENPFYGVSGAVATPMELSRQVKEGLVQGAYTLAAEMTENFRPPLAIIHEATLYRSGEEVEVPFESDQDVVLSVEDKNGKAPTKAVTWDVVPSGLAMQPNGSRLTLSPTGGGRWTVTARAGSKNTQVALKVVNLSLDWRVVLKGILKEVVNEKIQAARVNIKEAKESIASKDELLKAYKNILEEDGYSLTTSTSVDVVPTEGDSPEQIMSVSEAELYFSAGKKKNFYDKIGKFMTAAASLALELQIETYLNALIDNEGEMDNLVQNIKDNSPDLILQLVGQLTTGKNAKEDIKKVVINFLNERINEVAQKN